jgi:hypothetical protein
MKLKLVRRSLKTSVVDHLEQGAQRSKVHVTLELIGWLASPERALHRRLFLFLTVENYRLHPDSVASLACTASQPRGMSFEFVEKRGLQARRNGLHRESVACAATSCAVMQR